MLVYTVSKFSFPNNRIVFVKKLSGFFIYFYSVVLTEKGKTIPVSLKLPEG